MKSRKKKPDPRELPAYSVLEAAHFLNVPNSTIRYWVVGAKTYEGLIKPALAKPVLLSFLNLVEMHVIKAIRRTHNVPLKKIRAATGYISKRFKSEHPLILHEFDTDGVDLFIDYLGSLIVISQEGQVAMREIMSAALTRIERDPHGVPIRLYPFTRYDVREAPAVIVIDPRLSAGRPVIKGTGISTEVIAERYKAGESISSLARDYGREFEEIEEAIRCELETAA